MSKFGDNDFYQYLIDNGYFYEKELIENFLLSLKVKPFVILTGNSGTGKTKLAQLYANFISTKEDDQEVKIIETNNKVGKSATSGGWSLYKNDIIDIIDYKKYEKHYTAEINGIKFDCRLNINTRLFYNDDENKTLFNYLTKLREEDPDQKITIKIEVPKNGNKTNNNPQYEIIPVGSNWTENKDLLGFYNIFTEDYQETPAYNLINDANSNKEYPYFLILDEMNLSHVERYFADFLSALESGEKIPLYTNNSKDENLKKYLEIPNNLFTVGTVNVDETTYMFSPKVLDRANTIEFNTISAADYILNDMYKDKFEGNVSYLINPLVDRNVRKMNIDELRDKFSNVYINNGTLLSTIAKELGEFQEILKVSGFDFGFRVINEILRFMYVAYRYENEPENWNNWDRYFDAQIMQKMLPKLHGSQKNIGQTIVKLFNKCISNEDIYDIKTIELNKENTIYYKSALKLQEMAITLNNKKYVSFIN